MKLIELEPHFLKRIDDNNYLEVDNISLASGIRFLCPVCFAKNKGAIGTHSIICWDPSVPQTTSPTPGRWNLVGTGFNDLSLRNGSSSVLLTTGCKAHFFVTNGNIE